MWPTLLSYSAHRLLLLLTAFISLNVSLNRETPSTWLPKLQPASVLYNRWLEKTSQSPELRILTGSTEESAAYKYHPFFFLARVGTQTFKFPAFWVLLFLSNLICLLLLRELYLIFQKIATNDIAALGAILAVLWPTSYEYSLGSQHVMTGFLVATSLRRAMEDQWIMVGIAAALLALYQPLVLGLALILLYLFWTSQRYFPFGQIVKRTAFYLVPLAAVLFLRHDIYWPPDAVFRGSAILSLWNGALLGNWAWIFTQENLGQTISLLFLLAGVILGLFNRVSTLYRVIPLFLWILWLVFQPYGDLSSTACIAFMALGGIAAASSPLMERSLAACLILAGTYDVFMLYQA